jgi:hypothetical protein
VSLSTSVLRGAKLSNAELGMCSFVEADLGDARLNGAYLGWANLSGASLVGSDFAKARMEHTVFGGVDLSDAVGLESVVHHGPSTIGIDTLFRSKGKIPEAFLQGCGVPDDLIRHLPSILGSLQPIQFYSCFISYSTHDQKFAERLHSKMREHNLHIWFATEDIQGGKKIHEQIGEAIRKYDKLLLVLSPNSMNSQWVKTETRKARKAELEENRRKLFPIRLVGFDAIRDWECFDADTGQDLAMEIREYFIPDFSNWKKRDSFDAAFARLLNDLRASESASVKPD